MTLAILGKVLGILDLAAISYITLLFFDKIGPGSVIWVLVYLTLKGLMFKFDFNTWIEMGIGIYVILLMFGLHMSWIYAFSLIYMGQKGLMSLV